MFRILLFLALITSTPYLFAQDLLAIEEDVMPEIRRLNDVFMSAVRDTSTHNRNDWTASNALDSMQQYLVGKTVSGGYLTDRDGRVWNFGVLNQPYILHSIHLSQHLHADLRNEVADAFADDVLTFLVFDPRAKRDEAFASQLERLGPNVIVIEEEDPRAEDGFSADRRLIGLTGYPVTYYVGRDRKIKGINRGLAHYFKNKNGQRVPDTKRNRKANQKMYRKAVRYLMEDEVIKW